MARPPKKGFSKKPAKASGWGKRSTSTRTAKARKNKERNMARELVTGGRSGKKLLAKRTRKTKRRP